MEAITDIAQVTDVPVIVDAAAKLPSKENIHRYTDMGADCVAVNGGKAVRPQTKGILACCNELVQSFALQQIPAGTQEDQWDEPQSLVDTKAVSGIPERHWPTDKGR